MSEKSTFIRNVNFNLRACIPVGMFLISTKAKIKNQFKTFANVDKRKIATSLRVSI